MRVRPEEIAGKFTGVGEAGVCGLVAFFLFIGFVGKIFHNISSHLIKLVIMLIIMVEKIFIFKN